MHFFVTAAQRLLPTVVVLVSILTSLSLRADELNEKIELQVRAVNESVVFRESHWAGRSGCALHDQACASD